MHKLTSVKIHDDLLLDLTFDDGSRKLFDVTPYLAKGNFSELADPLYLKKVRLAFERIEWPNGQKFHQDDLYAEAIALPENSTLDRRPFNRLAFWLPFLTFSLIGLVLLFLAFIESGMRHSSAAPITGFQKWLGLAFPLHYIFKPTSPDLLDFGLYLGILLLQFPAYGFVLGYLNANRDSERALIVAGFIAMHLALMVLYALKLMLFG